MQDELHAGRSREESGVHSGKTVGADVEKCCKNVGLLFENMAGVSEECSDNEPESESDNEEIAEVEKPLAGARAHLLA